MNTRQSHLFTKAVSVLGIGTFAALVSLPAQAQAIRDTVKGSSYSVASEKDDSTTGPSVVPGETTPGPSETPSGSPSVPGNSDVDDPGMEQDSGVRRESYNSPMGTSDQTDDADDSDVGPSVVPGETVPGPSETPSGSPSVPGNSDVDDPGMEQDSGVRRESYNPSMDDAMEENQMEEEGDDSVVGPSVVPGEGVPGPSERPAGSPETDDAGKIN